MGGELSLKWRGTQKTRAGKLELESGKLELRAVFDRKMVPIGVKFGEESIARIAGA